MQRTALIRTLQRLAGLLSGKPSRPRLSFEQQLTRATNQSGMLLRASALERSLESDVSPRFGAAIQTPNNNHSFEFSNGSK